MQSRHRYIVSTVTHAELEPAMFAAFGGNDKVAYRAIIAEEKFIAATKKAAHFSNAMSKQYAISNVLPCGAYKCNSIPHTFCSYAFPRQMVHFYNMIFSFALYEFFCVRL